MARLVAAALLSLLLAAWSCGREPGAGPSSGPVPEISGPALREALAGPHPPVLLDVRSPGEFASGRIGGAVNIPLYELGRRMGDLEEMRSHRIVVYCEIGVRAERAARRLRGAGFPDVVLYRRGMSEWRRLAP